MSRTLLHLAFLVVAWAVAPAAYAQPARAGGPDPHAVLAAAKAAAGGAAWDGLRTQHSKVTLTTGGLTGTAERWADITTGRSLLRFALGPMTGAIGYDGTTAWSQDSSGQARAEAAAGARELAVNTAFRDRLAFWYPERGAAEYEYRGVVEDEGAAFDVVRITPAGGRLFEFWMNRQTHLIERMLERDAQQTRTETYMDFRTVQGVLIPFRVRATRGDPKYDELVVVDQLEYNQALEGVAFGLPSPPKPDFTFPAGRASVEVPFDVHNGHLFVNVMLNGKGPFRMLFDSGGVNVLMPRVVTALGLKAEGALPGTGTGEAQQDAGLTTIEHLDVGGIVLDRQVFATVDLAAFMQRVEGLDDVAGLVGYELFKRFPVKLDYTRSRAVFYDPSTFRYQGGGTRLPFRFHEHVPQVDGTVDGIAGSFDIDTGSRGSLTLTAPFVERNGLVARYGATLQFISGAGLGGHVRSWLARAERLELGDIVVTKPVTALSTQTKGALADPDLAGNVGYGVLRQFDITFDYASGTLYFEKNANFGQPDVHDRSGMWIERATNGFTIVDVVAGGPAAKAGLKSGDVIVAIGGKRYAALPLAQARATLRGAPGTRITLKLASGAQRVVTLRDLI